ncbi:MAG TPA: hypothetical protein PLN31_14560 [Azoarcus taiwanensis]|nr:hypothetical protein [Azoarcus taiwanensis]
MLDVLRPRWPKEWNDDALVRKALERLVDDARQGRPTSLPVVQSAARKVGWLSTAGSLRELREYLDDAKVWLEKVDAGTIGWQVAVPSDTSGPLAPMLKVLAPQGYVRWDTSLDRGSQTLLRLGRMHSFLATRPEVSPNRVPSVAALRLEFIAALSVGDWSRAETCIDEIDHWSLDHAPGTVQMRIRLLEARGKSEELFEFVCRNKAWNFANPRRIAAAIVGAVDESAIQPVESQNGMQAAYDLFRHTWYPKLVQSIEDARGEPGAVRLRAFAAAADSDRRSLTTLLPSLPTAIAKFLQAQLPSQEEVVSVLPPPAAPAHLTAAGDATVTALIPSPAVAALESVSVGESSGRDNRSYWAELHAAVKEGRVVRARALIASLTSDLLDDPGFLGAAPDALLELLSDPAVDGQPASRLLLYEVLAALVDAFVVAPGFPRLAHLEVYLSLLEGLVALRSSAANEADSQLVLGLVGAAANLSADACPRCEQIVRAWWQRRPILQRLDWLAAALDSLAPLHGEAYQLVDLYAEGLALAARKGISFTQAEARTWRAIGKTLELSTADIEQFLAPLLPQDSVEQRDVLADAGLGQIAIVSLRENSAQEAALQLESRTGARVSVVTSLVADADTRHASTADLILYVWAATSHATYRALDGCRDKIEYVQGTGASSIVMAAERWAARDRMRIGRDHHRT